MPQIGVVAPNQEIAKIAQAFFKRRNLKIPIGIGHNEAGIPKAEELVKKGVKVIISRGGTSKYIRENLNIPVVDINVTMESTVNAITKAANYSNNIAIVGYSNLVKGLDKFNSIFKDIKITQRFIESNSGTKREIDELQKKGIITVIGGVTQCKYANKIGMNAVFLSCSEGSISTSYHEALIMLNTVLAEERKRKEIKAIIDLSLEGYISINKDEEITLINNAATKLLNISKRKLTSKNIKHISKEFRNIFRSFSSTQESWNEVITLQNNKLLFSKLPLLIDGKPEGAIVTIQDVNTVQDVEKKIRKDLYAKGLFARYSFKDIIGQSRQITQTKHLAEKFAKSNSTILIVGETGTGKELFAQSIHNSSYRKNGPFIGVNCASLPESILESELFGYEPGAFTGASKQGKTGFFELAHEGTIFLDEISEIPLPLQGNLLRVLQEKSVMRLGSDKIIPIDIRIVAATNKNLADLVSQNKFRKDLYFRLNVIQLNIPPLCRRKNDIPFFVQKFLKDNGKKIYLSNSALSCLEAYEWPGNIRELENLIERLTIMFDNDYIVQDEDIKTILDENYSLIPNENKRPHRSNQTFTSQITKEEIKHALMKTQNNKSQAAKLLGIHRSTLWRWLNRLNINM